MLYAGSIFHRTKLENDLIRLTSRSYLQVSTSQESVSTASRTMIAHASQMHVCAQGGDETEERGVKPVLAGSGLQWFGLVDRELVALLQPTAARLCSLLPFGAPSWAHIVLSPR